MTEYPLAQQILDSFLIGKPSTASWSHRISDETIHYFLRGYKQWLASSLIHNLMQLSPFSYYLYLKDLFFAARLSLRFHDMTQYVRDHDMVQEYDAFMEQLAATDDRLSRLHLTVEND